MQAPKFSLDVRDMRDNKNESFFDLNDRLSEESSDADMKSEDSSIDDYKEY